MTDSESPDPHEEREGSILPGEPRDASGVEQLARRLQWIATARIGVLLLLAGATLAAFRGSTGSPTPRILLWAIAFGMAASFVHLIWVRLDRALTTLGIVQILGDLALWCIVVYLTGGAESAFSVLFHLSVIVGAFVFGSRGAALTAGTAAVLFGATGIMLREGLIVPPSDLVVVSTISVGELVYYLSTNIVGLTIVGALSGYLADRERRAGGQLAEARRASADLAALNDDIVRSLTSGLAAIDQNGSVLWVNPAGLRMLGRRGKEVVGSPIRDVIPIDDELPPPHSGTEGETAVSLGEGRTIPVGYRLNPLVDGEKAVRGTLLVYQDLSEIRTMREKVAQAQRLAGLGRLAAAMAHELRNPLGSISGSLEMLKDAPALGEDDRLLADIVLREIERLSDLVSQMLELARPRPPQRAEVDVAQMAREVIRVVRGSAEAEELTIELESPDQLRASGDAHQLRQLLWNLLRNATQATPPGGTVRLSLADREGTLVIEVEDDGEGIPDSDRSKVFEPFFSTKEGGIGMGLSVCRQVAEGHGGSIEVTSGKGSGARFTVRIPPE